jgi:vacuolar-type H+-ATPase subunit I/STV1
MPSACNANARHFQCKADIIDNFIPRMIFFPSIFGYLAFAIIYMWSIDWESRGQSPPSLLNMLISYFFVPWRGSRTTLSCSGSRSSYPIVACFYSNTYHAFLQAILPPLGIQLCQNSWSPGP